ncbi:MAG: hypothetical protein HOI66_11785 [Verrucomicrobia bacterium]|nr:hypothetical protein [Verrucomicrobiota bacterium]
MLKTILSLSEEGGRCSTKGVSSFGWGWLPVIALGLVLSACSSPPRTSGDDATRLAVAIGTLSPVVDPVEARRAAEMMVKESLRLAEQYEVVQPAWFHNVLVNSGVRERGLCYHWVNDLLRVLNEESFRSLVFYRGGANLGTYQEHNTIIVTAYGDRFENGLVVDAWRYQGKLFWIRVRGDELPWRELVPVL